MHSFFCQGASVETAVQHEKPKLDFFTEDLKVNSQSLVRLTNSHPDIWAYSLERNLRPSALAFAESCGNMTLAEYGHAIVKAPEILRCNWSTNLSRKLEFLSSTLNVPSDDLKLMTTWEKRLARSCADQSVFGTGFCTCSEETYRKGAHPSATSRVVAEK
jgi:hypothetical protein